LELFYPILEGFQTSIFLPKCGTSQMLRLSPLNSLPRQVAHINGLDARFGLASEADAGDPSILILSLPVFEFGRIPPGL
jgi:hypothetical protein